MELASHILSTGLNSRATHGICFNLYLLPQDASISRPLASMLTAAFTSRSCSAPHSGHIQARIVRSFTLLFCLPQQLHSWLDGYVLGTLISIPPQSSILYSSLRNNSLHDASDMDLASLWFFIIPLTFRSSMQTTWLSFASLCVILCWKSFLMSATFSCSLASLFLAFSLFFDL